MEAQTPKSFCGGAMAGGGKFQPNPFAHNLGKFVLAGKLCLQQVQNFFRRQFTVGGVLKRNSFRS
jgi:hypothetical protein